MRAEDFFDKEDKIYGVVNRAIKGDKKMVYYLLSERFITGLKGMIRVLGENERVLYPFISESTYKKIGEVIGIKIVQGKREEGKISWDKITFYKNKGRNIQGVIFSVRVNEKGKHDLINTTMVNYQRKPEGFNKLETNREKLKKNDSKQRGEKKVKVEVNEGEKVKEKTQYILERLRGVIQDIGENGAETFKVYVLGKEQLNRGKGGKWLEKLGYGIEGRDKSGNVVKATKADVIVVDTRSINKSYLLNKVSEEMYQYVTQEDVNLINDINHTTKKVNIDFK